MSNLTEKMVQAFATKADRYHNHDDVYPTKNWVNDALANVSVNLDETTIVPSKPTFSLNDVLA